MLDWVKHKLESRLPGRNVNKLKYAGNTTLTVESEEELKSLLMKVKDESEKVGLKLNIQGSHSDMKENSKALQTSKSWENPAPPNQLFNKC